MDASVSFKRAARRASESEQRRRAHGDSTVGKGIEDWAHACESFDRIAIPAPSLDVDTTDGYAPDLAEIVAFVNRA